MFTITATDRHMTWRPTFRFLGDGSLVYLMDHVTGSQKWYSHYDCYGQLLWLIYSRNVRHIGNARRNLFGLFFRLILRSRVLNSHTLIKLHNLQWAGIKPVSYLGKKGNWINVSTREPSQLHADVNLTDLYVYNYCNGASYNVAAYFRFLGD